MSRVLHVSAVGARVAIDLDGLADDAVEAIRRAWVDAEADARDGDQAAVADVTVTPRRGSIEHMMESLSQQVTLAALSHSQGKAWMLHAAGLAAPSGAVAVLVGPSGRGKTTASRTLARHFGYVSDETIRIDADGTVHAYRKPLSVIVEKGRPKVQLAASELGLQGLPDAPLTATVIVILDRDAAHQGPPQIEAIDLGDGIEELVLQSSFLTSAEGPLRFMAAVAQATGGVRRLRYAEAEDLVPVISALLDAQTGGGIPPIAASAELLESDTRDAGVGAARFRRAPHLDSVELEEPHRTLVLSADADGVGTVRMIAGIGPILWNAAAGATLAELTAAAVDAHGAPDGQDASAAVAASMSALMDAGLIVSDEPLLRRRADVAWVDRGDRVYALALSDLSALPRELDEPGSVIWDWLARPVTMTQLRGRAMVEAGSSDLTVADDVEAFVRELIAAGLVGAVEPTARPSD